MKIKSFSNFIMFELHSVIAHGDRGICLGSCSLVYVPCRNSCMVFTLPGHKFDARSCYL